MWELSNKVSVERVVSVRVRSVSVRSVSVIGRNECAQSNESDMSERGFERDDGWVHEVHTKAK